MGEQLTHAQVFCSCGGCWAAYYPDRSAVVAFGSEIEALRYAVEHSMKVTWWPYGKDISEAAGGL